MTNRDWISEANKYLRCKYRGLDEKLDPTLPDFDPELTDWESRYFLLGLEQGLFTIDCEGYTQSCFLPPPKKDKQMIFQLFNHFSGGNRSLSREKVCQLATVSYLVINRNWDKSRIKMEPSYCVNGIPIQWAVDISIESASGEVLVGCEMKKGRKEHEKLIRDFKDCSERGQHGKDECDNGEHSKFNFCSQIKPKYFFMVSPGKKQCLELTYISDKILINEIPTLPDRECIDTSN